MKEYQYYIREVVNDNYHQLGFYPEGRLTQEQYKALKEKHKDTSVFYAYDTEAAYLDGLECLGLTLQEV